MEVVFLTLVVLQQSLKLQLKHLENHQRLNRERPKTSLALRQFRLTSVLLPRRRVRPKLKLPLSSQEVQSRILLEPIPPHQREISLPRGRKLQQLQLPPTKFQKPTTAQFH